MSLIMHIKKDFGTFKLVVDLETTNDVTALLGASGSGKTMTLKCIAGLVKPDEGVIILNGKTLFDSSKKINLPPQKRKVGYLFQNYALFPNMSVKANIMCGMYHMPKKDSQLKERKFKDYIKLFNLEGLERRKPHQLSGGQQQRVALARILVSNPDILLLDEPFSALDEHLRSTLEVEFIDIIKKFGKDTVIVTHNKEEAYLLSNSIASIDKGHIVIYKNAKELFIEPEYVESAILSGCKNFSKAVALSDHKVFASDWGITLELNKIVPDDIAFISIRNEGFHANLDTNKNKIQVLNAFEEPNDMLVIFNFTNQLKNTSSIFWRTEKSNLDLLKVNEIGIDENSILLLKKSN